MSERQCEQCGVEVDPVNKRFCGMSCYNAYRRVPRVTKTCPGCGEDFTVRETTAHKYIHCSNACSRRRVTKTCSACGEDFSVPRSNAHRYTVCSWECRRKREERACERCGEVFYPKRDDIRHCSEECRRPPLMMECDNCGVEFRVVPAYARQGRRFCSFRCYRSFSGETSLEAAVRGLLENMGLQYRQERQFGRWSVDFYLPDHRLAIEADGSYWHPDPARDRRRDRKLAARGIAVLRVPESAVGDGTARDLIVEAVERHNLVLGLQPA